MSAEPRYVYGQGQSSRSSHAILLGLVIVETIGYKERKYRPNWRRLALLSPAFLIVLWVGLSEMNYFKERFMNGIPSTRRADMYLYLPDTLADSAANLFLDKEQIRLKARAKLSRRRIPTDEPRTSTAKASISSRSRRPPSPARTMPSSPATSAPARSSPRPIWKRSGSAPTSSSPSSGRSTPTSCWRGRWSSPVMTGNTSVITSSVASCWTRTRG